MFKLHQGILLKSLLLIGSFYHSYFIRSMLLFLIFQKLQSFLIKIQYLRDPHNNNNGNDLQNNMVKINNT